MTSIVLYDVLVTGATGKNASKINVHCLIGIQNYTQRNAPITVTSSHFLLSDVHLLPGYFVFIGIWSIVSSRRCFSIAAKTEHKMAIEYPAQFAANKQGRGFAKTAGINMRFKFRLYKEMLRYPSALEDCLYGVCLRSECPLYH